MMRNLALSFILFMAIEVHAASRVEQLETEKFCDNVAALSADAYDRKRNQEDAPDLEKWSDRPIIKWALDYGYHKADSRDDASRISRAFCLDHTP